MQISAPRCFAGGAGVLALWGVTTQTTPNGWALAVHTTRDGAASWQPAPPLFSLHQVAPQFVADAFGSGAVQEQLYATSDAGGRWSSLPFRLTAAPLFVSPQDGFAWSSGAPPSMWRTTDGGQLWTATPMAVLRSG